MSGLESEVQIEGWPASAVTTTSETGAAPVAVASTPAAPDAKNAKSAAPEKSQVDNKRNTASPALIKQEELDTAAANEERAKMEVDAIVESLIRNLHAPVKAHLASSSAAAAAAAKDEFVNPYLVRKDLGTRYFNELIKRVAKKHKECSTDTTITILDMSGFDWGDGEGWSVLRAELLTWRPGTFSEISCAVQSDGRDGVTDTTWKFTFLNTSIVQPPYPPPVLLFNGCVS